MSKKSSEENNYARYLLTLAAIRTRMNLLRKTLVGGRMDGQWFPRVGEAFSFFVA